MTTRQTLASFDRRRLSHPRTPRIAELVVGRIHGDAVQPGLEGHRMLADFGKRGMQAQKNSRDDTAGLFRRYQAGQSSHDRGRYARTISSKASGSPSAARRICSGGTSMPISLLPCDPQGSGIARGLFKNRCQLRQHLIHDRVGSAFQLLAAARAQIERAGLVTANNACRLRSGTLQRHGEAGHPRETSSARNREHYRHFCYAVERFRRNDQDRPPALLLVSPGGIKPDQPDFSSFHQINSPPTGLPSSHSRSSLVRRARGLHCASSSSRV